MKKILACALVALVLLPLVADAATIRATLTFQDNSDNETGFRIEKKVGAGSYATLTTLAPGVATYLDTPLAPGVEVCYRIFAVNEVGDSQPTSEACATAQNFPAAPSNVLLVIQVVP